MKFKLKIEGNIINFARDIGYIFQREVSENEISLVRPLERSGYPRFHLYLKKEEDGFLFNLHIDQKRPVYKKAHGAEYDSPIVEKEGERIRGIINSFT